MPRQVTRPEPVPRWEPLLQGDDAGPAISAITDIAIALEGHAADGLPVSAGTTDETFIRVSRATFPSGAAGAAIFFHYLDRVRPGQGHIETAHRFQEHAIDALATLTLRPALYGGLTGIAWTIEHLSDPDEGDALEEIDDLLRQHVSQSPWSWHYDLIGGLVGYGVYAMERLPRPMAQDMLAEIVDRFHELAVHRPDGIAWPTPPALLSPTHLEEAPQGYDNVGVAHGVPGVLPILAGAVHHGIRTRRARALLEGAVPWTLAQRLERPTGNRFPFHVSPNHPPKPSRLAWCYGDPGVAGTLSLCGRLIGRDDWIDRAHVIARDVCDADAAAAVVVDAPLCHGAAGLAHIYHRLHREREDEPLAAAARAWITDTLGRRDPKFEVGGFSCYEADRMVSTSCYLTGAAGIGLMLLAAVSDVPADWDRPLLLSLPRRGDAASGTSATGETR